jgi:hypothetical protein
MSLGSERRRDAPKAGDGLGNAQPGIGNGLAAVKGDECIMHMHLQRHVAHDTHRAEAFGASLVAW